MILILKESYLWYFGAFFVLVPHFGGNFIALYNIQKWQKKSIYISRYVNKYDWLIISVSSLAGFYTSIELSRSKLFYLPMFSMQLKLRDYLRIQNFRLFNTVLFELSVLFTTLYGIW